MPARATKSVYDGTTGGSEHGGRRTHIIQLLRDTKKPVSVEYVAKQVGIHINTARFHLESLVDAGLANRETEVRAQPGRRRVLYTGTLPNQTHERAHGYRLLSTILTATIANKYPEVSDSIYSVGQEWGRYLTSRPEPFETFDEAEIDKRVIDKLDALWFAPELRREGDSHMLVFHNCPFAESAQRYPDVVCQLQAGMINGSLEEMRSQQRIVRIEPQASHHICRAFLGAASDEPVTKVPVIIRDTNGAPSFDDMIRSDGLPIDDDLPQMDETY